MPTQKHSYTYVRTDTDRHTHTDIHGQAGRQTNRQTDPDLVRYVSLSSLRDFK